MPARSKLCHTNHSSRPTQPRNTKKNLLTELNYIPCSQINLHRSENPTAQFYYNIELNDDAPFIAFVQEPYCYKGKPKHIPGNGVTFYQTSPDLSNPRASLTVSNNLANQFFYQRQFSDRDMATCSIELPMSKLFVSSIYMDANSTGDAPAKFIQLVEHCLHHRHGLIIGTDSNAHHTAWGNKITNARGLKLLNLLAQSGLFWANNGKFTFKRNSQETAIDLTLRNEFAPPIDHWDTNPNFSLSDHVLIEFVINLNKDRVKTRPIRSINQKKCDWDRFRSILASKINNVPTLSKLKHQHYSAIYTKDLHFLNQQVDKLNNLIISSFTDACPPTFIRNKKKLSWWTKELTEAELKLIQARDDHENDPTDANLQSSYKEAHKALNALISKESNAHWQTFCSGLQKHKDVSKICKALLGNKNSNLNSLRKPDGSYTKSPKETLEQLATSLYTTEEPDRSELTPCEERLSHKDLNNIISLSRLDEAVNVLKRNKAPGNDQISNEMIIEAYDIIKVPLLNIFRLSLFRAKLPLAWQTSNSAILSKPGKDDYYVAKSYRIITLSSCTLKLMERIILWHLQRDLKLEESLSPKQYGFRKGNSTLSAIIKLVSLIESALKVGNFALGIFLDIQGAFDNIPFVAIKRALEKTKAKGNVSNWILHFISTRKLKLNLQGVALIIWILAGAPQGGVLSPVLWNIVLNSLIILLDTLRHLLAFADDLAIILTGFDLSTLRDLGQQYITACNNWCETNGLKLSAIKTQVIIFSRKYNISLPRPIRLQGLDIEFCNTVKYLGIHLDSRLNWHEQVHKTAKKCTNILFATRKMIGESWGLSPDKIIWVYNAIIKPIMTYACVSWAPRLLHTKSMMKPLNRPGNLALLIASGARRTSSQEVLHQLFSLLPAALELEKASLLQALRLNSTDHWPSTHVDFSNRPSLVPCHVVINRILNVIFGNYDPTTNDLCKPSDISSKNYNLNIADRDMVPESPNDYVITTYTDGSKHADNTTGYGVVIYLNSEHWVTENHTLSTEHTVFQCEAHALLRASILLSEILASPPYTGHRSIIYTDSQALIKALSKSYTISKTIKQVHFYLNTMSSNHLTTIEWVPGHQGHYGNELADKLANIRTVTASPELESNQPPLPHSYLKNKVHHYISARHKAQWNDCIISQNTKELVTAIVNRNLQGQHLFKLGFEVLRPLTRLITGHNNLNHFQNKINFTTAPFCSCCEEDTHETPLHLICNCEHFSSTRMNEFGEDPITIDQLMRFISLSKEKDLSILLEFVGDYDL